jgi:curved DNA-binding protein CbpA
VENFYEILGIPRTADQAQIKAAYKKLAKEYHPDANPRKTGGEEAFKKINEAYHTLADPLKKLNYDSRITLLPLYSQVQVDFEKELKRRRYWYWKRQQEDGGYYYKLDKEYFRIQALAFLVFICISGFFFGLVHTADYVMEQKHMARWKANSRSLKEVNGLFANGRFDDAFSQINVLKEKDPLEIRFLYIKDSLIMELRTMAESEFTNRNFSEAISYYLTVQDNEQPVRFETIEKIAMCEFYLGNYKESIQAFKHLLNQRPWDLELVYQIGIINLEKLENPEEALQYFTLGKKIFKQNLSQVYGAAFEIILDPQDVPDIYYDIFEARAKCNLLLKNYNDAVTDGNWAVFLRPTKGNAYYLRAQAYSNLDQKTRVCKDLNEARLRGISLDADFVGKNCR